LATFVLANLFCLAIKELFINKINFQHTHFGRTPNNLQFEWTLFIFLLF
jgi:hypothetical protein